MAGKLDQLQQLSRMLEAGQITQAEFDALKSELLGAGESQSVNLIGKPAGWYAAPSGGYEAYWDGKGWTGATRRGVVPTKPRKPVIKRVGFWLLMIFVVFPMVGTVALAGVVAASGTAASANSSDDPTASGSGATTTTTPTATAYPIPPTARVDWDGIAAALDRWPGEYGEALNDVWDTSWGTKSCEDLAFDVRFAMDYLTFPNQAQADKFTTDLALVAGSRAELINCTLNFN